MHKLLTLLGFPLLAIVPSFGQDQPSPPPELTVQSMTSLGRGMPEEFFPELRKILNHLESEAPVLRVEREREKEALARKVISDGRQGWRVGIGADAYSLHENRSGGAFDNRQRFLASANARRPLYHWGALDAGSRSACVKPKY